MLSVHDSASIEDFWRFRNSTEKLQIVELFQLAETKGVRVRFWTEEIELHVGFGRGRRFARLHHDLIHNGFELTEFLTKRTALVMSHGSWFEIGVMKMIIVLPKQSKKLNFGRHENPTAQN